MPTVIIEDLEVGETVTVICDQIGGYEVEDPDPGEEDTEEAEKPSLKAVKKVVGG